MMKVIKTRVILRNETPHVILRNEVTKNLTERVSRFFTLRSQNDGKKGVQNDDKNNVIPRYRTPHVILRNEVTKNLKGTNSVLRSFVSNFLLCKILPTQDDDRKITQNDDKNNVILRSETTKNLNNREYLDSSLSLRMTILSGINYGN